MDAKPTYEELEKRCYTAEAILKAIRTGEADTVMSEQGLLVLRLEKELIETRVLYALSRALNEIGTFENAIQKAADLMAETLKVDRLNIILFDLAAQTILHYARGGPGKHTSVEVPFAELQEGLSGWVLQNHQAALSPKAGPDPRESQTVQARRQATHSGAIIVVPILYHKTLLGTLTAINRLEQRDFTQDDVELLEAVAHQTGVLIRNNQLYTDLRQQVALRQQTQRELETAYAEQEQRVKERTAELAEKNQVLEREVLERKKAEEKAQANERVLQLFVEYAPAAIAMLDREMKYIAASRRYLLDYRLGEQNLVGRSHYEIFPEIPDRWKEIHRRCLAGATEKAEEDPFPRGDGTLDWVRWEIHPWYENSGDLGGIILFSEVITERIQAKLALQEREQKLQQVLELLPVGVSILGAKRQVVYENPALHAILGITPEELRQGTYQKRKYIGADGSPLPFDQFASVRAEKSGQAVHNIETGIVKENGETIWTNVSAVPVNFSDWKTVIVTSDLTERKQAETALRQSEERLRLALSGTKQGLYDLNVQTGEAQVNDEYALMLGYDPAEFHETNAAWIERLHPEDTEALAQVYRDYLAGRIPEYRVEFRQRTRTGSWKWILSLGKIVEWDVKGQPLRMLGTHTDITARKQAEEALRRSEERFRTTFEGMLEGTQIIDFDWRYTYLNATAERHNRRPNQELLGRRYMDMWPGIEETHVFTLLKSCMEERTAHHIENEFVFPDGMVRWYELSIQPVPEGIFILSIDITERKLIEESLRQSEEKYRLLAENISDVIWILDMQTSRFRYISPSVKHLRGYSAEEALALDMGASLTPASAQHLAQVLPARLEEFSQGVINYYIDEIEQPCKDGGTVWTETTTRFIVHPETGQLEVYGVSRDISERKRAEEQRAKLVERLDLATSAARMGIWDWDIQNNILVWDDQMVQLYGQKPGEFAGAYEAWVKGVHPDDREAGDEISAQARRGEAPYDTEFRVIWPDKSVHWLKANGEVFFDADGNPLRMVGVNYDITERKLAEAALRLSEENFSKAFKSTPAALLMTRLSDGKIIELNEAYTKIVGYPREALLGRRTTELNIYLDTADRQQIVERLLRTGSTRDVELDIRHRSGAIRHVIAAQEMITFNGETCILTSLLDITSRKQLEEAVRTASQRFQLMLQSLYGGILVLNNDNQVEFANHAFCELFDLQDAPDALLGLQARDIIEKITQVYADPPLAIARIAEIVNAQQPVQDEEIAISGGRTYLRDFIPIEIEGHLYGRMWHHLDITERKRAEQELRESHELFQMLFDLSPVAYSLTRDGMIIDINPACEDLFGYSRAETVGRFVADINFWVDKNEQQKATEEFKQNGELRNFEFAYQTKTGMNGWAIAFSNFIKQGKEKYILSEFVNITERKQAEDDLRQSNDRFMRFVEANIIGIVIADAYGKINLANDYYLNLLHVTRQDLLEGQVDWKKFTPPEWFAADEQALQELSERGICAPYEKEYQREDGTRVPVYIADAMLPGPGDQIAAFILDITERKRSEIELRETLEELKRSNAELEQFAYVASHDLQEPLRAVAGMVQLLQQRYQGQLDARADEYICHAVDAAGRMQTLINDLLAFSRVDRHGRVFAPVDSALCLQSALKNLDFSAHKSNAKITWENLPTLTADGMQLIQLFQNLISNALKFQGNQSPEIHVRAERTKNAWQFSVSDNGIGIEPQYFERIFLIFQRLHTRREYPGTGVGLAICKKIVERHGGQIWVESKPGQGSTFTFTIPIPAST